jgi:hypothetical protein
MEATKWSWLVLFLPFPLNGRRGAWCDNEEERQSLLATHRASGWTIVRELIYNDSARCHPRSEELRIMDQLNIAQCTRFNVVVRLGQLRNSMLCQFQSIFSAVISKTNFCFRQVIKWIAGRVPTF